MKFFAHQHSIDNTGPPQRARANRIRMESDYLPEAGWASPLTPQGAPYVTDRSDRLVFEDIEFDSAAFEAYLSKAHAAPNSPEEVAILMARIGLEVPEPGMVATSFGRLGRSTRRFLMAASLLTSILWEMTVIVCLGSALAFVHVFADLRKAVSKGWAAFMQHACDASRRAQSPRGKLTDLWLL